MHRPYLAVDSLCVESGGISYSTKIRVLNCDIGQFFVNII